ncbi:Fur family zinc uptake transcriptional regulator [Paraburkholderia sp. MM5477-R1]
MQQRAFQERSIVSVMQADAAEIEVRLARARSFCETRGVRFTPVRALVLRLLLQQDRFFTAYELLERMREVRRSPTPTTVYRTLDFLIGQGLAHRLDSVNGYVACRHVSHEGRYALAVCTRCGRVLEVQEAGMSAQLESRITAAGFRLDGECVELRVVCGTCPS